MLDPSQSDACAQRIGAGITIFLIVSFQDDAELIVSISCRRWSMNARVSINDSMRLGLPPTVVELLSRALDESPLRICGVPYFTRASIDR